ncbi:CBO0543 family protein [Tigheibacillus jepli]|uniref:CBO0543 family protein n=1 Tax=Tigheibacillus jepli TaxID=3035914 RepID=UPI00387E1C20
MNIVKRWSESKSQSLPKEHSHRKKQHIKAYFSTIIFASLIGTYLDLIMVGAGLHSFPSRIFPQIFTINILFSLCMLPLMTFGVIFMLKRLYPLPRFLFLLTCSLAVFMAEQLGEQFGLLAHSIYWRHAYSAVGYFVFFVMIWKFYRWLVK